MPEMTVKQLIKHLKKYDPDLRVLTEGYEDGFEDPVFREVIALKVAKRHYFNGEYDEILPASITKPGGEFEALLIGGLKRKD